MDQIGIPDGWLTTDQAAELVGYTPQHVARLARLGRVQAIRVGRDWLISRGSLLEWTATARTGPRGPHQRPMEEDDERGA